MREYIEIQAIPKIQYAHAYQEDGYKNILPAEHGNDTVIEIAYILEGNLNCVLPDGQHFTAPTHSVMCNFHHEDVKVYTDQWHEHHTVGFSVPVKFTDEDNPNGLYLPFISELPPIRGKILSLIDEIILARTVRTKGDMTFSGLILQLLDELNNHNRQTVNLSAYSNYKYVKKAKKYIFNHLNEAIYQTDIAKHLDISSEYLCSVFKSSEGMPIMQFINRVKLEQIHNLMKKNGLTLAKASELYGYNDPNYVSRLYKKYFNHNITDFKRNI